MDKIKNILFPMIIFWNESEDFTNDILGCNFTENYNKDKTTTK